MKGYNIELEKVFVGGERRFKTKILMGIGGSTNIIKSTKPQQKLAVGKSEITKESTWQTDAGAGKN